MSEYTVRYINYRAESDAAAFIHDCEEHYHRQIHMAADEIMRDHVRRPIVLINGPSSSGKTTTNDRIARIVELAGVHAEMLSMDDYYRTATEYDQPMDDENGVPDLESPECMDLERLSSDLKRLAAGEEVSVPRFDFETRTSIPHDRTLQLGKDEVIMIEGIHSFNPVIMGDLAHRATSIYLSVASALVPEKGARRAPLHLALPRTGRHRHRHLPAVRGEHFNGATDARAARVPGRAQGRRPCAGERHPWHDFAHRV